MDVAGPTTDSVLWQVNSAGFFGTPIFIEGNYLVTMRFLGSTNAPVECYDLTSGNLLWSVDVTNSSGRSLPVGLHDERVFVVRFTESPNDTLYALDVSNGSHLWTSNVNGAPYITETGVFHAPESFAHGSIALESSISLHQQARLSKLSLEPRPITMMRFLKSIPIPAIILMPIQQHWPLFPVPIPAIRT